MTFTKRLYSGPDDLRLMQSLVQDLWDLTSRNHIGDLAWGRFSHLGEEEEWPIALWEEGGTIMGWGWVRWPDELVFVTRPEAKGLADEILAWFEGVAPATTLNVEVLEAETDLVAALAGRGYVENLAAPWSHHTRCDLSAIPPVNLPDGFRARNMADGLDIDDRARAHTDAWSLLPFYDGAMSKPLPATSKVSGDSYRQLARTWPWRPELDWVIEAPDGRLVACCIIWLDEKNKVAELEPVGTHPDFRRRGLGQAVCLAAMNAARDMGAETAIVYPRGDDIYPVPMKTYLGIGFAPYGRTRTYELK